MTTRLSIVTVVKDDLAGLRATHASLRAQRCRGFDWIVVDGASTDGSAAWIARHGGEAAWWRSAPDDGLYDAMNIGLDAAAGSHVLFLNAGDTLAGPGITELLLRAATDNPEVALFYGDALESLPGGGLATKPSRSHRLAALGMFTHHQAMLYRRQSVAGLRFDGRFELAADYAFTLAVLKLGKPVIRIRVPLCVFAPGGRSQREAAKGRREQAMIRRELLGHGILANAIVRSAQWTTETLRQNVPRVYAKFRYHDAETSCLSSRITPKHRI